MKKLAKLWKPIEVFKEDAWKTLANDINADIRPEEFIKTLIDKELTGKNTIEGIQEVGRGCNSLLWITETRTQKQHFENFPSLKSSGFAPNLAIHKRGRSYYR